MLSFMHVFRKRLQKGSSVRTAIRAGFSKAFSAIIDGNITTLIASAVLMWLGSGTVKGFAYTLALGIVVSMFTALVISRLIMNALYAVGIPGCKVLMEKQNRENLSILLERKISFLLFL